MHVFSPSRIVTTVPAGTEAHAHGEEKGTSALALTLVRIEVIVDTVPVAPTDCSVPTSPDSSPLDIILAPVEPAAMPAVVKPSNPAPVATTGPTNTPAAKPTTPAAAAFFASMQYCTEQSSS